MNQEIILKNSGKEPMDFERLKFLCYFAAGMVAEVLGFGLGFVVVLSMAGVLH